MKKIQSVLLIICIIFGVVFMTACNTNKPIADNTTTTEAPKDEFAEVKDIAEKFAVALIESDRNILFEHYARDMEKLMDAMLKDGDVQELLDFYGAKDLPEFYDKLSEGAKATLRSDYGDDYKITAKTTTCEKLDGDTLKIFIENCKIQTDSNAKNYDVTSEELLDTTKIEEAVKIIVECKLSGSNKTDTDEKELYGVFIDGKWKMIDDVKI